MGHIRMAIAGTAIAVFSMMSASPPVHADPPPLCGGPDGPPCADPGPPPEMMPQDAAEQCEWIAWRTMMPCNWLGQQVPQGTPGSWG